MIEALIDGERRHDAQPPSPLRWGGLAGLGPHVRADWIVMAACGLIQALCKAGQQPPSPQRRALCDLELRTISSRRSQPICDWADALCPDMA
jgi:hypothetical protein